MEEGNKMIWIGIGILALLIAVGALFVFLRFGSDTKDKALGDLTAALGQVDTMIYSPYDNEVHKGASVSRAIPDFDGKPTIILVSTLGGTSGVTGTYAPCVNGGWWNYLAKAASSGLSTVPAKGTRPTVTGGTAVGISGDFANPADWNVTDYNRLFSAFKDRASKSYIKPTGTFWSFLIKDPNDVTIGIAFVQQN